MPLGKFPCYCICRLNIQKFFSSVFYFKVGNAISYGATSSPATVWTTPNFRTMQFKYKKKHGGLDLEIGFDLLVYTKFGGYRQKISSLLTAMIADDAHFSLVFSKNTILVSFRLHLLVRSPEKGSCFAKTDFQQFESGMVDFITKDIGGRVMQISGEQCGCVLLVCCDIICYYICSIRRQLPIFPIRLFPPSRLF